MRRFKILYIVALLGLFGCSLTTDPQYPQPEEEEGGQKEPNKGGFLLSDVEIFFG